MSIFNNENRIASALKISIASLLYNIIQMILAFVYRSIFVQYFSVGYLGLNGLFANILTLMSLSEMGITTPIIYRLYKPMADKDINTVSRLMGFYKVIYRYIFTVIIILGLLLCPFIKFFVKDLSQIPEDINIYYIYILFLIQTASTYLYAYKQSLLIADRKQYIISIFNMITCFIRYFLQIYLVFHTHNYVLILVCGIFINLLSNILLSCYVTKKYTHIFIRNNLLDKETQNDIFKDSKKCLMHRIGNKILTSTDNIVISKTSGIIQTGLYSNYTMISEYLTLLFAELLGNYAGIIGNVIASENMEYIYKIFKRLNFLSLWINATMTVMLCSFFNIFMVIWLGDNYCFSEFTVALICIYFFLTNLRIIPNSFIGVSPLFTRDALRPLIQAVINLIVSVVLALHIGVDGVIIGSIVCVLLTVFWREPYLLYKYFFRKSVLQYWCQVILFSFSLIFIIVFLNGIFKCLLINSFWQMILAMIFSGIFIQIILIIIMFRIPEFQYYRIVFYNIIRKIYIEKK